ncbi:MAG: hypothetical protein ABJD11_17325 [Gemmatimonadota bacterium]
MDDRSLQRRKEFARRARQFYDGRMGRSEVLADVEAEDYADPVLKALLEVVQNQPKKSRFSGLWGRPYDAYVDRARSLIDDAER